MAMGFSGSNGGIVDGRTFLNTDSLKIHLEVSYFVNNVCNLRCRHCYVGYEEKGGELSVSEWINVFDELIKMGALTFGNVGKEPLLSQNKTLDLLRHLEQRRQENPRIRFGLVTNGTLLKRRLAEEIAEISPDYIDVSLDGDKEAHDYIRGEGNYTRTVENLKRLPPDLAQRVFISYTLMRQNKNSFGRMVEVMGDIGLKHFLISPYVPTPYTNGQLTFNDEQIVDFYQGIVEGKEIDFSKLGGVEFLLKSDYDSQKPLINKLVARGIIDVNKLLIDNYGVIFNRYPQKNDSEVVINYIPFSDTLSRAVRISHDGYVSGCLEMFYKDYPKRAKANLREQRIEEILSI